MKPRTRRHCATCKRSLPGIALIPHDGSLICVNCLGSDAQVPEVLLKRYGEAWATNADGKALQLASGDVDACDLCAVATYAKNLIALPWLIEGEFMPVHACHSCAAEHCVVLIGPERELISQLSRAMARARKVSTRGDR